MTEIHFSKRAQRDLRAVDAEQRRRIADAIASLGADQPAANLDVRPIVGRLPWMRLRVGDWRVLYRRRDEGGWIVGRVVDRQHLERTVASLETLELN